MGLLGGLYGTGKTRLLHDTLFSKCTWYGYSDFSVLLIDLKGLHTSRLNFLYDVEA